MHRMWCHYLGAQAPYPPLPSSPPLSFSSFSRGLHLPSHHLAHTQTVQHFRSRAKADLRLVTLGLALDFSTAPAKQDTLFLFIVPTPHTLLRKLDIDSSAYSSSGGRSSKLLNSSAVAPPRQNPDPDRAMSRHLPLEYPACGNRPRCRRFGLARFGLRGDLEQIENFSGVHRSETGVLLRHNRAGNVEFEPLQPESDVSMLYLSPTDASLTP